MVLILMLMQSLAGCKFVSSSKESIILEQNKNAEKVKLVVQGESKIRRFQVLAKRIKINVL